ncbi:uncharacterized protein Pyn_20492 [Prunus yedoensis var. nudiflora]|uniref:O-fucosyltransferase family protein n=1 Tax=Prunus yedoensis var. nudiflora TaxID=2094558 RepID=A0A314XYZ3_PRUYE|nr:uncharacterized protein Pyn_20492 [Prunus yedoensis var. nudiflora]
MKLHKDYYGYYYPNQSQRAALAGLLVVLFPAFFPNLFGPLGRASPSIFSEWNAPKARHLHLLNPALLLQSSVEQQSKLWSPLPNQGWKHCLEEPKSLSLTPKGSTGYIQVFLDGGLNQQKMGICDAVAVAKILNATLVVPHLEVNPVWQDSSSFEEIFDLDHFIEVLRDEVSIVKDLPTPVQASSDWYLENALPILQRYGVAAISPFSHRLTFENLPKNIQLLRCKVNFQALAFVPHIRELGETLVNRLRYPPNRNQDAASDSQDGTNEIEKQGAGKFVVLHLRFDKDMAAHSACDFGGDEELRNQGRCPLTPEEIGLLLAALGFNNSTRLYLASHKVYGGEARISTLRRLFPLMEDKKSLASAEERAKVEGKASLLAAVDYYVSMQSDIFISASPGNMHNALVGHRAYMNLKTIRPSMSLLGKLFVNKSMEWSEFQHAVLDGHKSRQGQIRSRKEKQSIYTYPAPDCMCQA